MKIKGLGPFVFPRLALTEYLEVKSPDLECFGSKLKRLGETVHAHGAKVVIQLLHCGKGMDSSDSMVPLKAFSDVPSLSSEETPHVMTVDKIDEIMGCFVRIARKAKESGNDGVELRATHGYLHQQSWSPWANMSGGGRKKDSGVIEGEPGKVAEEIRKSLFQRMPT